MDRSYGIMLCDVRKSVNAEIDDIIDGFCSKSVYSKYENEIQHPDILAVMFLLQRMGVSLDKFELVITDEEYQFLEWKKHCLEEIAAGDWEKLSQERAYFKRLPAVNEKLQRQFLLFVDYALLRFRDRNPGEAFCAIDESLKCTLPYFERRLKERRRITAQESHILLNWLNLAAELEKVTKDQIQEYLFSLLEIAEDKLSDQTALCEIFAAAAIQALELLGERLSGIQRESLEKKALKILVDNYSLRHMVKLLEHLAEDCAERKDREQYHAVHQVLKGLYLQYGAVPAERVECFSQTYAYCKLTLLSDAMRNARADLGISQEEASGDICALRTYVGAENGKHKPNHYNREMLAERLGLRWIYYSGKLVTNHYKLLLDVVEYKKTLYTDKESAKRILDGIVEKLDLSIPENRQQIEYLKIIADYAPKTEGIYERLDEILKYTCRGIFTKRYHSKAEKDIIYLMADSLLGKDDEKVREILEYLERSEGEKKKELLRDDLVLERQLLADLFLKSGEYDKCLEQVAIGIRGVFKCEEETCLRALLGKTEDIARKERNLEEAKETCEKIMLIADLYHAPNRSAIRSWYERQYQDKKE